MQLIQRGSLLSPFKPFENRIRVNPRQIFTVLANLLSFFLELLFAALLACFWLVIFHQTNLPAILLFLFLCLYSIPEHFRRPSSCLSRKLSALLRQSGFLS